METMNFKEAIAEISNQKKHDKHSICYMLFGMNVHGFYDPDFHKRAELIEKFISIGTDNYHKISHFRCFIKKQ